VGFSILIKVRRITAVNYNNPYML